MEEQKCQQRQRPCPAGQLNLGGAIEEPATAEELHSEHASAAFVSWSPPPAPKRRRRSRDAPVLSWTHRSACAPPPKGPDDVATVVSTEPNGTRRHPRRRHGHHDLEFYDRERRAREARQEQGL